VIKLPTFYQDFEGRRRSGRLRLGHPRRGQAAGRFKNDKLDGVVLDLRNNGGGSLDEAVDLTGLFIDRARWCRCASPVAASPSTATATGRGVGRPAGRAADQPRFGLGFGNLRRRHPGLRCGLVIGEPASARAPCRTSSTSTAFPSGETQRFGRVKLTIAQFFRISGSGTQHKGVVPDMAFPASVDATEFGESTYDNALPWTRIAAVPHTQYGNFAPLLPRWKPATTRASRQGIPVVERGRGAVPHRGGEEVHLAQ
jgi:carboxyl-terminal processing protease